MQDGRIDIFFRDADREPRVLLNMDDDAFADPRKLQHPESQPQSKAS